jgi:hypothetical protein
MIRRNLFKQLERLEERVQRANAARRSKWSATDYISGWLARKGIVRLETESLMDAFARSLGITVSELRVHLQRQAARAGEIAYR